MNNLKVFEINREPSKEVSFCPRCNKEFNREDHFLIEKALVDLKTRIERSNLEEQEKEIIMSTVRFIIECKIILHV